VTVTAERFTLAIGPRTLLPCVDFTAEPGRITVVSSASGGGKTTLFRALLGAVPAGAATAGRLDVDGTDPLAHPGDLRAWRRAAIAYANQDPGPSLSPVHTVARLLRDAAPAADPAALLDRLGLDARLLRRRVGELSGGQVRRVALARAAARPVPVLLLDEPTAGLDSEARTRVADLLSALRDDGRLLLIASHDPAIAANADQTVHIGEPAAPRRARPTPAPAEAPVLTVRNLTAAHAGGAPPVVSGVDLELHRGQITGLTGESGSGKTTIARALAGLHPLATGALTLDGADVPLTGRRSREQRRRLQYIAQDPRSALNPMRTVGQALIRAVRLHQGLTSSAARAAAAGLLADVGLSESVLGARPAALSGGQRQRVAIARALAANPDVLIADEITAALDHSSADRVMDTLTGLADEKDLSILLISHDIDLLDAVCTEVCNLTSTG
jgi:peptide/nickel transport system ATP-binding protein